jgi:hypothetical protein
VADGERRMVFDTRGRRKNVIRVVYAVLALLMGASLFLVVGPFNLGELVGTDSTSEAAEVLEEQAERTEQRLLREPDSETLLLSLTRTRIAAANAHTEVNPETGAQTVTAEGVRQRQLAAESWDRYLKQAEDPKPTVALLAAGNYFGLAETSRSLGETVENVESAAAAQRIAAESQPTINSLTTLAIYEYYAGNFAAGDKAARQAEALVPNKAEVQQIEEQMKEYRKRGKAFAAQKKQLAQQEKAQGKEALQNPLGGLSGGTGSLGE